jgi:hypothetical protein
MLWTEDVEELCIVRPFELAACRRVDECGRTAL